MSDTSDTEDKKESKEPSAKERLAALEAWKERMAEVVSQKDAQIADLLEANKKMSASAGTTKEQQEADALALRTQRAGVLSKEIGGMTISHAVAADITPAGK